MLEKDTAPVTTCLETVFPDAKAAEPALRLFRILAITYSGKKSKLKKELIGLLQELMVDTDKSYFSVFQLLNELREADIGRLLEESSNLGEGLEKSCRLLGFKSTYPIMCLVDIFTTSSTLSNSVLICSLREILSEGGMLEKKEKEVASKNFNTSKQQQSIIEQYFLAMIYLSKGDNIDLKSIAKTINKKNPNAPNIDSDALTNLEAIS